MYQIADFGRGLAPHRDMEQLLVDWEDEKVSHRKLILHLKILKNHS